MDLLLFFVSVFLFPIICCFVLAYAAYRAERQRPKEIRSYGFAVKIAAVGFSLLKLATLLFFFRGKILELF